MNEAVLTCPSYASNVERQAILDAAQIAGIKCPKVINEGTAIALKYGFYNSRDLLKEKPRNVAFVDLGCSKTTVTIAQFTPDKVRIVAHHSDRNLGGRDFDYAIMEKCAAEFDKKYGNDPMENVRCKLRIMEAVEKARKILTADTEAGIGVDYLLDEQDLVRNLKRDEMEEIIKPITDRFAMVCREAIELSKLSVADIEFVELLGDCTRTPVITTILKDVFQKTELFRTMKALECVTEGATMQAAMLSPSFTARSFKIEDYNALPLSVTYHFADKPEGKKTMELFTVGSNFPITKSLSFKNKLGNMSMLLHYNQDPNNLAQLMKGLPTQLASYEISEGTLKHSDRESKGEFVIKVENNLHQIACLHSAELAETWTEMEKIPIASAAQNTEPLKEGEEPKPAPEQKYETKERTRTTHSGIKFDTSSHAIPPQTKTELREKELAFYAKDLEFLNWKKIRNELEGYSYEMKSKLDEYGNLRPYMEPTQRDELIAKIGVCVEWIYDAGETAPYQEYEDKLKDFQSHGQPALLKYRFYEMLPDQVKAFNELKTTITSKLSSPNVSHLTDEQIQSVHNKIEFAEKYLTKIEADLAAKNKWDEPGFTNSMVEKALNQMNTECTAILNTPKPKPVEVVEEKPAEAAPATASADAEMKPEGATAEAPAETNTEQVGANDLD